MTTQVDPRAVIDPTAALAEEVTIGAFSVIGPEVTIGAGTTIGTHVTIERWTTLGERCHIGNGTMLGGAPQHLRYEGAPSYLHIGHDSDIRELVVIHRSMVSGGSTIIGAHNFIMSQVHVAHDCLLGDHVIVSSLSALAGHVEIEERATIGGMVGVHQFVRIGAYSMLGGGTRLFQDVPPFMLVAGNPATVRGLNAVGLRRAGFALELRRELKTVYRLLYRSGLNVSQALDAVRCLPTSSASVAHLVRFIEQSKRGLCS